MTSAFAVLACAVSLGFGQSLFFTPKGLTEIKFGPTELSETVHVIKQGEVVEVVSTAIDSAGREWCKVRLAEPPVEGFIPTGRLEYVGDLKKGAAFLKLKGEKEEDAKRRLKVIKEHPEWPRRLQRAVRDGTVCLKMTAPQLSASWGAPSHKTKGFILGAGDVEIFFYQPESPVSVILKNGEVIGWSEKGE